MEVEVLGPEGEARRGAIEVRPLDDRQRVRGRARLRRERVECLPEVDEVVDHESRLVGLPHRLRPPRRLLRRDRRPGIDGPVRALRVQLPGDGVTNEVDEEAERARRLHARVPVASPRKDDVPHVEEEPADALAVLRGCDGVASAREDERRDREGGGR